MRRVRRSFAACVAALVAGVLLIGAGDGVQRALSYEQGGRRVRLMTDLADRVRSLLIPPGRAAKLVDSGLPVYDLRIRASALNRLHAMMGLVQLRGNTDGLPEPDYERAEFRTEGPWVPVRVKLRGWTSNHYSKPHPSLRIRFPSTHFFENRRQINLVDPYDKFLTGDPTSLWEAQQHGILTWDCRFVVLRVNGEPWGLYLEIEQPGVEMTDRLGRSEGYIFSAGGQLLGKPGFAFEKAAAARDRLQNLLDPSATTETQIEQFIENDLDADKMAWAAAIMAVTGHWGSWLSDNVRLYFDPARGRFEPIPWDYGYLSLRPAANPDPSQTSTEVLREDGESLCQLGLALMGNDRFRSMRDQHLWTLINERIEPMVEHSEREFESIRKALERDLRRLTMADAIAMQSGFASTLRDNAQYLKMFFEESGLRATWCNAPDSGMVVSFENSAKAGARVTVLVVEVNGRLEERYLPEPAEIPARWRGRSGQAQIYCDAPAAGKLVGIRARNALTGEAIGGDNLTLQRSEVPLPPQGQTVVRTPIPRIDGTTIRSGTVHFGPGLVMVRESVEFPAGLGVVFEPGLDLRLGPGVSLLLNGDLTSVGRPDAPIRISSLDPSSTWGVLAVQGLRNQPAQVELRHTEIVGGRGGQSRRVIYTGSFSVHDGDVTLEHVRISLGADRDDGLNFKYSTVRFDDVQILDQPGDGVDLDFCKGEIRRCTVRNVGGDAFDISGSQITFQDCEFTECGDKGMSIGERSQADVTRVQMRQARSGIAIKDESAAVLTDCVITGCEIGAALYVKKPSFGLPTATLHSTEITGNGSPFMIAPGCSVQISGAER